jgi:hypothetical protein
LLVGKIGLLDIAGFERGVTPPEGFLGQGKFLLAARNLAVRIIIDRVKRRLASGARMRRSWADSHYAD